MKMRVIGGPNDGATVTLEPGVFQQEGLPEAMAKAMEDELRSPQVFRVFETVGNATDGGVVREEPPLDSLQGIDAMGLQVVRRLALSDVRELPE